VRAINWWVAGAIALASVSAMLPVLQNSATTSRGFEVQELQARQVRLEGEIATLESNVARLTSLARIQKRAAEIGLGPASSPIYISVDAAGPAPAKIPAEFLPVPERTPEAQESVLGSLLQWVPSLKP
jgi:hypothetical protein